VESDKALTDAELETTERAYNWIDRSIIELYRHHETYRADIRGVFDEVRRLRAIVDRVYEGGVRNVRAEDHGVPLFVCAGCGEAGECREDCEWRRREAQR
jgi:hypothetical protein